MKRAFPALLLLCSVSIAQVTPGAMEEARQFVRAKLLGEADARPARPHMMVYLKRGQLQKDRIGGRLFRIKDREFDRGIVMPSPGEVLVNLPAPGAAFEAFVGVDSNDLGYYSNQGRGGVEASVEVRGRQAFRSATMREGLPATPVKIDLAGAKQFRLKLDAVGEKPRTYQAEWDQADWAMARVSLADGRTVWLADLPVGPLAGPIETGLPFSFRYDGRRSEDLLKGWTLARNTRRLDAQRIEHTLVYSHPESALMVRCVAVEYNDFPAVEWTLHFSNQGQTRTAVIEDIQALATRLERAREGEFLLHHNKGSWAEATDYQPFETPLGPKAEKRLASRGGRGTDGDFAYFNLAWPGRGVIVAVGWPGQWAAEWKRDEGTRIEIRAGQEQTHFRLLPGEQARSPLMALVFWEGDWINGQNVWRRWMVAHNLPRNRGRLHPPQIADGNGRHTIEMQDANEANQIQDLNRHLDAGVAMDYWWMDAGWYPFKQGWWNTGTWEPDPARFPHGFKPISDAAHARSVKTLVWFEPERVTPGSWLDQNHPEWLLKRGNDNRLLDLGNDQARTWLTEHVSRLLREQGIDLYRQDFNFEPLKY